jgi:hypothetical protein
VPFSIGLKVLRTPLSYLPFDRGIMFQTRCENISMALRMLEKQYNTIGNILMILTGSNFYGIPVEKNYKSANP